MSASFEIHASEKDYQVEIALGLLKRTLATLGSRDAIFICDAALAQRLACDPTRTITVEATEYAKDLANLSPIMAHCKALGTNRQTMLYAIGGGVVQDIACFVASVYMRGMKWAYFPTTLLGMVDSCIGGKSSINAGGYKNLVGTFHPPEAVYIDPELANSLSTEQKVAGLAEAVKICFSHEGDFFGRYLALKPTSTTQGTALEELIALSLSCKKWFIEIDEFDQNERQLLNFGHTFGHAIEAATDYAVSHGVAVAIGMLLALRYAEEEGLSVSGVERCTALKQHVRKLLSEVVGLSQVMATFNPDLAVEKFTADKKHDHTYYWIITPHADGYLRRVPLPKTDITRARIRALFEAAKEAL